MPGSPLHASWSRLLAMMTVATIATGGPVAVAQPLDPDQRLSSAQEASSALAQPPSLGGTWAQEFVTASTSRVPVVGEVDSVARTFLLVEIAQEGRALRISSRVCAMEMDTGSVVRTEIPRAFVRALPARTNRARLLERDGSWSIRDWSTFEVIGADLPDPQNTPLPRRAGDPYIVDQDGDGHPGMTVNIRGMVSGEIYVVQRGWSELDATTVNADRIDGAVRWSMEQRVLGASRWMLDSEPPTWPSTNPAASYFRTVRLADGAGCTDVVARGQRGL